MDVIDILDELSNELSTKRGMFAKKPDIDRCSELVEMLTKKLPKELEESNYIVARRKEILENADAVAKNTIRAAEERVKSEISHSETVIRAQEEAKKIIETAYSQCDALIARTKAHLDGLFKETEQFLLQTVAVVKTNREELRSSRPEPK